MVKFTMRNINKVTSNNNKRYAIWSLPIKFAAPFLVNKPLFSCLFYYP